MAGAAWRTALSWQGAPPGSAATPGAPTGAADPLPRAPKPGLACQGLRCGRVTSARTQVNGTQKPQCSESRSPPSRSVWEAWPQRRAGGRVPGPLGSAPGAALPGPSAWMGRWVGPPARLRGGHRRGDAAAGQPDSQGDGEPLSSLCSCCVRGGRSQNGHLTAFRETCLVARSRLSPRTGCLFLEVARSVVFS